MKQVSKKQIIRVLERIDRQIIRDVAKQTKQTEGEVRRILFGRKNGKSKWKI